MNRFRNPAQVRPVSAPAAPKQDNADMKRVKNDGLQAVTIFFKTENGSLERWLRPGESVVVPESYLSDQVKTLNRRRVLRITNA